MIARSAAVLIGVFLLLAGSAACGRAVDLKTALQVADASTGWFDAGVVDGKNKLVPSITFRLKNTGTRPLTYVSLNLMFMVQPQNDEWDAMLIEGLGATSLAPGASSAPITVRGKYGYTGVQPRAQMLQNRSFQDFSIKVFAKKGSSQWTPLGEFKVARQLLTQ
jgi:hypothetical protein